MRKIIISEYAMLDCVMEDASIVVSFYQLAEKRGEK